MKVRLLVLVMLMACGQVPAHSVATVLGNRTCPVSGEPVAGDPAAPTFSVEFEGVVIGFMCPMHRAEFLKGTDAQKRMWLDRARGAR